MDSNSKNGKLRILLISVLAPVIYTNASRVLGVWESSWMLSVLASIYIGIGAYIWHETFKRTWPYFFLVLILIPIGVIIDVVIDFYLRDFDRNLFPFEIVILWVVTPIPLLLGMSIHKHISSKYG